MFKHYLIATLIALCTALAAGAQLTVGGHATALDQLTATYLCSVDESLWGTDFTAAIDLPSHSSIKIDGTALDATGSYTFSPVDGTKRWVITAVRNDGAYTTVGLQFTFLPIVEMEGTVEKNVYNLGKVNALMPGNNISSPAKLKFRGSSTNRTSYNKRNYHIKFVDENQAKVDYRIFDDCRKDNSWLLDGGVIDHLRVRNRVITDLWLDINSRPYYNADEPKALLGVRGHMVEVLRDGRYVGIYNLSEAMDRKQLKLAKWDETTGNIHGQLWKESTRTTTTMKNEAPAIDNTTDNWNGMELQYPDLDDVATADHSAIYDLVDLALNASDEEFEARVSQIVDMPVFIDIQILNQLILAYDNYGKNLYWALYDRDQSPMLTPVPWDFDTALGQPWNASTFHPAYLNPNVDLYAGLYEDLPDRLTMRLLKWNVDSINDRMAARYHELRQGPLSRDNITQRFTTVIDQLNRSGATAREKRRWDGVSDLGGRTIDLDAELAFVLDWLDKRLTWLDNVYFAPRTRGDVNGDGIVDITDVNLLIGTMLNKGGVPEIYTHKCDTNGDHAIDITDVNRTINIMLGK